MTTKNRPTFERIIKTVGDCVPVTYAYKSKNGDVGDYKTDSGARGFCRETCLAYHGPRPSGAVVRHLCENDSTAPSGFVCCNPEHIKWDTQLANVHDVIDKGMHISQTCKPTAALSSLGGKAVTSKIQVCERCGHTGKFPNFGHHKKRCLTS